MRLCPACGNQYGDEANFCPMDATRLPPPDGAQAASAPPTNSTVMTATTTFQNQATPPVAGRYFQTGPSVQTPTGTLFEAKDNTSGATVMLKLVAPGVLPSTTMADRALRELKQLQKVASERIVRVLDQGRAADGQLYIATEATPGSTLEELIAREGALPVERATQIVLQIGEALTEAQKVGVIHRDVAPRNVLVLPDGQVKVGEFGLAERVTEKVFGAPAYLSPEQADGKPVDQRSNIYSLGAIFYFALTGQPPFTGDAKSLVEQHATAPPSPPSTRRPGGLPGEIDRIVMKALEKTGGRRHLTLRQLLSEIEAVVGKGSRPTAAAKAVPPAVPTPVAHAPAPAVAPVAAVASPPPVRAATAAAPGPARALAATVMGMAPLSSKPSAPIDDRATLPTMPVAVVSEAAEAAPDQPAPSVAAAPSGLPSVIVATSPSIQPGSPPVQPDGPQPVQHGSPPVQPSVDAGWSAPPAPIATAVEKKPVAQPAPVQAATAKRVEQQAAQPKGFRETAWFKKGEIEEELARRQAEAAAQDPLAPTGSGPQTAVVDENNIDVSAQDRARLSLKSGATQNLSQVKPPPPQTAVPGERMDEEEMLAEIDSSKKWFMVAGLVVLLVVGGALLYFFVLKPSDAKSEAPAASPAGGTATAATTPTAPAPQPTPTAVTPTAPAVAPVAAPPKGGDPAKLLNDEAAAARRDDYAAAVDFLERAAAAGANAKDLKKAELPLTKALSARALRAKKRKERALETESRALLARLRVVKPRSK